MSSSPVTPRDIELETVSQSLIVRTEDGPAVASAPAPASAPESSLTATPLRNRSLKLDPLSPDRQETKATDPTPTTSNPSSTNASPSSPLWQLMTVPDLIQRTHANVDVKDPARSPGLSPSEAAQRLAANGPNILTPPPATPMIVQYLRQYLDPFMILLALAGVLSCIAYAIDTSQGPTNLYLGFVLFFIMFISSTFSFFQERQSDALMNSFGKLLPRSCTVIREGKPLVIPAAEVVVGDVVRVKTGDQAPADLRAIWVAGLKVELTSLTGESRPCSVTLTSSEKSLVHATNMVFSSCNCVDGEGLGVVVATGDNTMIGTIAGLAQNQDVEPTTLQKEIIRVVRFISILAACMATIFFIVGLLQGHPLLTVFVNGVICVLVANVPQGLPVTVMSCLTIVARRMSSKNVFVKRLQSVETLGSASVIASDKTGTLTMNQMTVSNLWFDRAFSSASAVIRDPKAMSKTLDMLEMVAAVNNRAQLQPDEAASAAAPKPIAVNIRSEEAESKHAPLDVEAGAVRPKKTGLSPELERLMLNLAPMKVVGDASDTALFRFADSFNDDVNTIRSRWREVFSIPFNSSHKYALSIVRSLETGQALLLLKGAPEVIVKFCGFYADRNQSVKMDDRFVDEFEAACRLFGSMGERVLGFAMTELSPSEFPPERDHLFDKEAKNFPTTGLQFLGLISLIDPPKPGVPEAIVLCRRAGIRVMMVTGDHPITAAAIAKKVGIITQDESDPSASVGIVTGTQLEDYKEADWDTLLVKKEIVLARTTPQQKLELVKHLQRLGNVVAVTGDGVNDAPALKKADIGVAMGISGSDVARDAADVILMDDNFSSMVTGIREGRVIFDNLTKTIAYTLTHLWPEVMPVLCNLALGIPLPLSAMLILCVDTATEMCPAVSLSYEKGEPDVMLRPPRNVQTDRLVTFNVISYCYIQAGCFECLMCFLGYLLVFVRYGIPLSNLWNSSDTYFKTGAAPLIVGERVFLASEQVDILAEAQSTYFMVLVMSQFFHIWFCRTRKGEFYQPGLRNMVLNYGVIIEVTLLCLLVYVPGVQTIFATKGPAGVLWLLPLGSLVGFGLYSESVKWFARNRPGSYVARWMAW